MTTQKAGATVAPEKKETEKGKVIPLIDTLKGSEAAKKFLSVEEIRKRNEELAALLEKRDTIKGTSDKLRKGRLTTDKSRESLRLYLGGDSIETTNSAIINEVSNVMLARCESALSEVEREIKTYER